jgi:Uma2 family endonuclease
VTWPPDDRPLTVDDLDLTPDDGSKYELDDGVLVVSPPPTLGHQLVVSRLATLLDTASSPEFVVIFGVGVSMSVNQYRIPDVVVLKYEDFDIAAKSVTRPPVLAIEVASPSTALYDRNRKKDVYARFGIPMYWIVTPNLDKPSLTVYEPRDGGHVEQAQVTGDEVYRAERPFAVEVCPATLVARNR